MSDVVQDSSRRGGFRDTAMDIMAPSKAQGGTSMSRAYYDDRYGGTGSRSSAGDVSYMPTSGTLGSGSRSYGYDDPYQGGRYGGSGYR